MPSMIPDLTYGKIIKTGTDTQFGCLHCLHANLEAPSENDVVYLWGGVSLCASHAKIALQSQQKA